MYVKLNEQRLAMYQLRGAMFNLFLSANPSTSPSHAYISALEVSNRLLKEQLKSVRVDNEDGTYAEIYNHGADNFVLVHMKPAE